MKSMKKFLAFFLTIAMVLPTFPVTVLAAEPGEAVVAACEEHSVGEDGVCSVCGETVEVPEVVELTKNVTTETQAINEEETPNEESVENPDEEPVEDSGDEVAEPAETETATEVTDEELMFEGNAPIVGSLLPLKDGGYVDFDATGLTPIEMTRVSLADVLKGKEPIDIADANKKMAITYYDYIEGYVAKNLSDKVNMAYGSSYYYYTVILGDGTQDNPNNVKYRMNINNGYSSDWLKIHISKDGGETETNLSGNYFNVSTYETNNFEKVYGYYNINMQEGRKASEKLTYSIEINSEVYPDRNLKVYEGMLYTEAELVGAKEITSQIVGNSMKCPVANADSSYSYEYITLVTTDASGNVTGILPVELYIYCPISENQVASSYVYSNGLIDNNGSASYSSNYDYIDGVKTYEIMLKEGKDLAGKYKLSLYAEVGGEYTYDASKITAAYVGKYSSDAEAKAAGASDIKDLLFDSSKGYEAAYNNPVDFTIIIGETVHNMQFKTVPFKAPVPSLSNSTAVEFTGLKDKDGKDIKAYLITRSYDSQGENSYPIIMVGPDVDITNIAPVFSFGSYKDSIKLYVSGSSVPEESGKSYHDFSKGAIQYTASSESKEYSKNYWLEVIKAESTDGKLVVTGMTDANTNTRVEDGVVVIDREVMLDSIHNNLHNVFVANVGMDEIKNLKVELESDTLVLDEYWTLNGNNTLAGYQGLIDAEDDLKTTVDPDAKIYLPNIAKVKLMKKEDVNAGSKVSGKLTFKSGDKTLMVINLTGTIGDPVITTKEIPNGVKYVSYGTMIQNSNKYSWNKPSYELRDGELPEGMSVLPNGELYGVPVETGTFDFSVIMVNSGSFRSDICRYTLVIAENTDANVDAATNNGYELLNKVSNIADNADLSASQELRSQGVLTEFVDLYLDGQKLVKGVDYTAESGSTRIIITNTTLTSKISAGKEEAHTLNMEFRTADNNTLMRAAQNYYIGGNVPVQKPSSSSSSSNGGGSSSASNSVSTARTIQYTVVAGDTLSKIAVKFYGKSAMWRKIFDDNKDVLKNPNKLRIGQVLTIYIEGSANNTVGNKADAGVEAGTYVVKPGDSLWKIAKKAYGDGRLWNKICAANNKVKNPHALKVGEVLVIPE